MPPHFAFEIGARVHWQPPWHTSTPWTVHQRNYWDNGTQTMIHYALVPDDRPLAPARWVAEGELRLAPASEG